MVLGRLFSYFPAVFWQFVTTQGGKAPHRGHQEHGSLIRRQVSPTADGEPCGTQHAPTQDSPGRKPCETPPSLTTPMAAKSTAGLTKGHLVERALPSPLKTTWPPQSQVSCPSVLSHGRQVWQGGLLVTKASRWRWEMWGHLQNFSAATFNQSHCPYLSDFSTLNFPLVLWKRSAVKDYFLKHENASENAEEPPPYAALIKETWKKSLDQTTLIFGRV